MNILEVLDLAEPKVVDVPKVDRFDELMADACNTYILASESSKWREDAHALQDKCRRDFHFKVIEENSRIKSMFKDGIVFSEGIEVAKSFEGLRVVKAKVNAPELPVAKLNSLRNLCDAFGFIMIPFECYNMDCFFDKDGVYDSEIKKTVENIIAKNVCNSKFYVITPIGNYDIRAHVMYNGDKQLYLGQHATLLGGVMLQIPLFREIFGRLEAAEKNIVSLDKQIKSINDEIGKLKDEQIKQKLEALEMFEAAKRLARPIDPILISVDTDDVATENGEVLCSIHYQWGPDFTDEVAEALNLEVKKHQSEKCFSMFKNAYVEEQLELLPEDAKLVNSAKNNISENIVRILNTSSLWFMHDKYWNIFHNSNPSIGVLQNVYSQCNSDIYKERALNLMLWR